MNAKSNFHLGCLVAIAWLLTLPVALGLIFSGNYEVGFSFLLVFFLGAVIIGIVSGLAKPNANEALICPHCQTKGKVSAVSIMKKAGISGGKATAAVLTGGLSVLATGLSRKEKATQAHCSNCGSTWIY
jgi:hypothetical protein